jgi:anti-sigma28 factor (negative regulator of flagellin synthesis)
MTTKKIAGNDEVNSELVRSLLQSGKKRKGPGSVAEALDQTSGSEGVVDLGLAKEINSQLNPENIVAERKEKVARLKALIESGQYNPPSELVAQSVHEDIVMEILSSDVRDKIAFGDGENEA